jgi:hypothetical protein
MASKNRLERSRLRADESPRVSRAGERHHRDVVAGPQRSHEWRSARGKCRVGPGERRYTGEQHCGERPDTNVGAGPRAEQEGVATRRGLGRIATDGVM